MKESLLSHIAGKFVTDYENVANSSIAYMLNKYPSVITALKNITEIDHIPLNYICELSTEENGRPDVVGFDEHGNKKIIIEGKFWANLTDNQPNNYLKELDKNGILLFLAPVPRLESLHIDIERRLGCKDGRIIVNSWREFIKSIEIENKKSYNEYLDSDLFQFKELCHKMDHEGLPPISWSDLDPMNGRVSYQFADLLDECNASIRNWGKTYFGKLKTTHSKDSYGFYFEAFEFGLRLFYSSKYWYDKDSHTPFWLNIAMKTEKHGNWKKSDQIYHFLNMYDPKNSYDEHYHAVYGITLQPGMDRSQIINHITNQVKKVLLFLHEKM